MLKIRLTRMGAKKNPFYRIVVIDSRAARNGVPADTLAGMIRLRLTLRFSSTLKRLFTGST